MEVAQHLKEKKEALHHLTPQVITVFEPLLKDEHLFTHAGGKNSCRNG